MLSLFLLLTSAQARAELSTDRPFAVHWNIVGANAPEVVSLIKPALNACITYDVMIFGESLGHFPPGHTGAGFASTCEAGTFPCGLAAVFNGAAHNASAPPDFSRWEDNYTEALAEHGEKVRADVVAAGAAGFDGVAVIDYENWFVQWESRWQESFNGPFMTSWMQFVTAVNFPKFDQRMWQLVGATGAPGGGWTPPANTTGWGDVTQAEQQRAYAASWDYFMSGFVNATLTAAKAAAPRAKWGFFAYPWFRHPRQLAASAPLNDDLAWLWAQLGVLAPAFYPEFYTTSDPATAPCKTTNTPAEDAALYTPNVREAVRLRDTFNPSALVLPYVGWYNPCGTMCSPDNIHDMVVLPSQLGADGVVLFGAGGPGTIFPTAAALARSINDDWGPAIRVTSTACSAK